MRASKGFRRGTRSRLSSSGRRITVNDKLKSFSIGDKVCIVLNSSQHKAMPHPRYQGSVGVVKGTRGNAYLVSINDGGKSKTLISYPEHLKAVKA